MKIDASKIVKVATEEWKHWGQCTWNTITGKKSSTHSNDDDVVYSNYVINNYISKLYGKIPKWPTPSDISQDNYAWSAVTISYFLSKAGFTRKKLLSSKIKMTDPEYVAWLKQASADEFPLSEAHHDYIRWSIAAKAFNVTNAAYWGYRIDDPVAKPEVGDLVGYVRGIKGMTKSKALKFYDRQTSYQSHTDLVTDVRKGEIDVIGGNVRDSVCKKTLRLDANGLLSDSSQFWFVVMKKQ